MTSRTVLDIAVGCAFRETNFARVIPNIVGGKMPVRSLITGGAGFIGSHLAEALLAKGEEVYALDNLSTGSMANIDALKSRPGFHYVLDSVRNDYVVAEMVDRCDVVYHLAAAVGVKLIVEDPVN